MLHADKLRVSNYIRFEKRLSVPTKLYLIIPLVSLFLVLVLAGILFALSGYNPWQIYSLLFEGAAGNTYNMGETIVRAIPLMLTGLAVCVAFKMLLWNIGADGQLYFGAFMAGGVALYWHWLPDGLVLPVMVLAGFIGGALWGLIPAIMKVAIGVNETLTTLLLNYVAILWMDYLVFGPWKDPEGYMPFTAVFPDPAMLPSLPGTRIHLGLLMALILAIVLWVVFKKTTWGYEIGLIGESQTVARFAGLNISKNVLLVMLLSGGIAGLAGMAEVSGVIGRLQHNISPGYGYTAIVIAWLARLNPLAIILVAIFFGGLNNGGYALQIVGLPESTVTMLQGGILFFVLGGEFFTKYRIKLRRGVA